LLLGEEKILVVKEVALVHDCGPVDHDAVNAQPPLLSLYSQMNAAETLGVFVPTMVDTLRKGSGLPPRQDG
jgi:hypothetical protein